MSKLAKKYEGYCGVDVDLRGGGPTLCVGQFALACCECRRAGRGTA